MNKLPVKRIFLVALVFTLAITLNYSQTAGNGFSGNQAVRLFDKSPKKKNDAKIKKPRSPANAKKAQEKKEKKLKQDYTKSVKASQKRSYEIQTPEVKARMRQNKKDFVLRDKVKKKRVSAGTKKAGKKYKK